MKVGRLRGFLAAFSQFRSGGAQAFTLVEVMIVLAVTGGLFISIAVTLSGRQASAEFVHASQSLQSEVEQVINQASAGNYPIKSFFTCSVAGSGLAFASAATDNQGTNSDCVLLGRVLQFQVSTTNSAEQYQAFTVAGCRVACAGSGSSVFAAYAPTVVGLIGSYDSYSVAGSLKYGMQTVWVRSGATPIGAVAFMMEPGTLSLASTNGFVSGAQTIDIVPLLGTGLNQTLDVAAGNINAALQSATLATGGTVQACFRSTGSNESALMNIVTNGGQLAVSMTIIAGSTTCS